MLTFQRIVTAPFLPTILMAGLISPALSADYISANTPKSTLVSSWKGPYAGEFFGFGSGETNITDQGFGSADVTLDGATGGILMGYNLQSGQIVYGVEADLGIHEFKGNGGAAPVTPVAVDHLWSGHLRARVGYDFGRVLPFMAAGLSFGEQHLARSTFYADGDIDEAFGWTAGAGVDIKVTQSLIGRLEYLYEALPDTSYRLTGAGRTIDADTNTHIIRAAAIVRGGGQDWFSSLTGYDSASPWAGSYVGLSVGGAMGEADLTQLAGVQAGARDRLDLDGMMFGALLGWQTAYRNVIVGLEGDVSLSSLDGSVTGGPTAPVSADIFWLASSRVRLGYDWGNVLPYLTGGYALAQVESRNPTLLGPAPDPLKSGFTVGAGLDLALSERITGRVSYDYVNLGDVDIAPAGILTSFEPELHLARAALIWKLTD
jgi:outer membrane immunogenic protein